MSNIEAIEIFAGRPEFPFKEIRRIEVKCEASNAFMPAPTVEEANDRMRALASSVGANAIIDTQYQTGISITSWKSLKVSGMAVLRESEDKTCPECAETIRRAARKCRYCGAAQEDAVEELPINGHPVKGYDNADGRAIGAKTVSNPADIQEPLRDNNNSAVWWIMGGLALLMLIGLGGL